MVLGWASATVQIIRDGGVGTHPKLKDFPQHEPTQCIMFYSENSSCALNIRASFGCTGLSR
jgi:hypothetical protein